MKLTLALALALQVAPAAAAVAPALDVDALARGADRVLLGRVKSLRTVRVGGFLATEATVAVDACHKGPCDATVVVQTPGGLAEGIREVVPGAAELAVDEEVVLFLRAVPGAGRAASPMGPFTTMGMAQGKFRVVRWGALRLATRALGEVRLRGARAPSARAESGLDLRALEDAIDAALAPDRAR